MGTSRRGREHIARPLDRRHDRSVGADWGDRVEADLLAAGLVRPGDAVVLLAGKPLGRVYSTSTLAVHRIGSPMGGYRTI